MSPKQRQLFNDGFSSYPFKRINYPTKLEDEKIWLGGWYAAQHEKMERIEEPDGTDNWWAFYK